ncbi:TIR domain-containing protein [Heliobacterium chlorum]|uniref:TIR domain-containing protein n=1 Tax=Heliobacterium chlorum TaxID=2698 RepID=A0ABR7T5N7_HELCL|nr:TIR domain-containing protein [Heliobacterium chlorum]MBC9786094.1 TIR domain-containing protein [Heliobacterium chlorum]
MKAYLIDPKKTLGSIVTAIRFFNALRSELEQYVEVVSLCSENVLKSVQFTDNDVLIIFNRPDNNYDSLITEVLTRGINTNTEVIPVALDRDTRTPHTLISTRQSFDVVDQINLRSLTSSSLETIAVVLARVVVVKLKPNLSRTRMCFFLSHRRADGEIFAATLYRELCIRAEHTFRDLTEVLVGEDAQEVIERNLCKSDVVLFLDTPKAGESKWVARELQLALALNIPIVWIKVGLVDGRSELPVRPAREPHLHLGDLSSSDKTLNPEVIESIIETAFKVCMESGHNVFDRINRLKSVISFEGANIIELDQKNLIYEVQLPRRGFRYPQRPMTHLVQFYGRHPEDSDIQLFDKNIQAMGYIAHPKHGHLVDAALLLAPSQGTCIKNFSPGFFYVDSADEYLTNIHKYISVPPRNGNKKNGVIISGSFPMCGPIYQQNLTTAIHALTQAILDCGGRVIFGGHPTFQPLIFDLAKRRCPYDYKEAIRLYISKYFVSDKEIETFKQYSTVIPTKIIDGNREKSLTVMRQAMINDENALGLVALGGRSKPNGTLSGVDEEIEMALRKNLPVYLIGSCGGRVSEIASELDSQGWVKIINNMNTLENRELLLSLDYTTLALKILDRLGL